MAPSSLSLPSSLLCYLAVISTVTANDPAPFAAKWSDLTFGPDGPWPAVEVTLGVDQKIALYPGREFQSFLLTSDYCNGNDTCPATKARLYNKAQAQVDNTGSAGEIQWAPGPNFMNGLAMAGENAQSWIDNMDLGGLTVPNVSLALLSASYAVYPDDTWYPLSAGCLGIGAPGTVNQTFTTNSGPAINASLIPGWLDAENQIPSNSFAMHIGSANPAMPGSLYFGGYDRNRIIGDILTEADDYTKAISLQDIAITVVDGSSPWDFESKDGLLATNNASISAAGIKVSVDGCSPYLTLPKSTCDAIASHLPVTYNKNLGLYIWQEDDPKYSQIVSSASSLDFTFLAGSNTKHVTISVPFRHLNLTLSEPLVDSDQQYFPCYTGSTQYTLGRAFLQDAFVGANWDSKTWWLAQAPGPNIPTAEVVTLASSDTQIQASENDWKESWSGSWKALTPEDIAGSQTVTPPSPSSSTTSSKGLSTGAVAGIGVGVGLAVLAIIGALAFLFFRSRKAKSAAKAELDAGSSNGPSYPPHETPAGSYNPQNGTPQQGYYAPIKNPGAPGSPGMSDVYVQDPNAVNQSMYGQQYAQQYAQQYGQQYPGGYAQPYPQQYSAELPVRTPALELPGPEVHHSQSLGSPPDRQPSPNPSHELPSSSR
ncbi:putative aspartic-type endopeptidase [Rosellinia necatrix]|uniref:Putative aspartic-type endopeptidase n=1 Tax=Rosellinia necatrix TaxID=77044 RepID=A0A1W2TE54_ROSNE|nr:putative aspartic-type endopeptidase [Rosellinia necatrix]